MTLAAERSQTEAMLLPVLSMLVRVYKRGEEGEGANAD